MEQIEKFLEVIETMELEPNVVEEFMHNHYKQDASLMENLVELQIFILD